LKAIGKDHPHFKDFKNDFVNVIIFSTKEKRPEQHKMSGGDWMEMFTRQFGMRKLENAFSLPLSHKQRSKSLLITKV